MPIDFSKVAPYRIPNVYSGDGPDLIFVNYNKISIKSNVPLSGELMNIKNRIENALKYYVLYWNTDSSRKVFKEDMLYRLREYEDYSFEIICDETNNENFDPPKSFPINSTFIINRNIRFDVSLTPRVISTDKLKQLMDKELRKEKLERLNESIL